jgi:hypothetical protein
MIALVVLTGLMIVGFLLMGDRAASKSIAVPMAGLVILLVGSFSVCALAENTDPANIETLSNDSAEAGVITSAEKPGDSSLAKNVEQEEHVTDKGSEEHSQATESNNRKPGSESDKSKKPDWIVNGTYKDGQTQYIVVSSDPQLSPLDVEKQLNLLMEKVVSDHIDQAIHAGAGKVTGLDASTIREKWMVPGHIHKELCPIDLGSFYCGHVQLKLDTELYEIADLNWNRHLKKQRLFQIGLFSGSTLLILAVTFCYFRIDNASQGLYTGRLQIFSILCLLGVIAASVFLGRQIQWW